jgi:hypothetical protein
MNKTWNGSFKSLGIDRYKKPPFREAIKTKDVGVD